ncbi:MAG: methylmalonyl-CoA mutase family protein [Cyclobacteriaceae bacterium]|nr:hypothetical protein [Cyclobacteriaceae bacterium]MCH8515206.1 methylmalonyl-CoA mutase family protein [Cyclobacteriaceae bacterium]
MEDTKKTIAFSNFEKLSKKEWIDQVSKELNDPNFERKISWKTGEGFDLFPYQTEEDLEKIKDLDLQHNLSINRIDENYGLRHWVNRVDINVKKVSSSNSEALELLEKGAEGVHFHLEDLDEIDTKTLLQGIGLKYCDVSFSLRVASYKFILDYIDFLKEENISPQELNGSLSFDPIGDYLECGDFPRQNLDIIDYLFKEGKDFHNFKLLTIRSNQLADTGASAVQQLSYNLGAIVEYADYLTKRGHSADFIFDNIQLHVGISGSYFLEIAKLRALRSLVSRLAIAYQCKDYSAEVLDIHAEPSIFSKSILDPYTNMLRSTTEAMSAVIGGCDSLTVPSHDATFVDEPSASSKRIARNVSNILKEESYLHKVVDAAAGSYYIEVLTHYLIEEAWNKFIKIEEEGGMLKVLDSGQFMKEVIAHRNKQIEDLAYGKKIKVGVNMFPNVKENIDPAAIKHYDFMEADDHWARPMRASAAFEKLRLRMESYGKRKGSANLPVVAYYLVGENLAMQQARMHFIESFFGIVGFPLIRYGSDPKAMEHVRVVVFCGSDEDYPNFIPKVIDKIDQGERGISCIVAGNNEHISSANFEEEIYGFVHARTHKVDFLSKLMDHLEIIVE